MVSVLSLNIQYYEQYQNAEDKESYERYLKSKVSTVDAICVQEDLWSWSDVFLRPNRPFCAFTRVVSSFTEQAAHDKTQSKKNVVHYDESFTSTLGNSIYVKKELLDSNTWTVTNQKVVQISSSDVILPNGSILGYRSVVCVTLDCCVDIKQSTQTPQQPPTTASTTTKDAVVQTIQILCTHLTGGRFEDVYLQESQMVGERARQMEQCLDQRHPNPKVFNILVGDFNASATKTSAMDGYFQMLRQQQQHMALSDLNFYSYMLAPFVTLDNKKYSKSWRLLYDTLDGPTSRFGHVVDYFVVTESSGDSVLVPSSIQRVQMIKDYMEWVIPTVKDDIFDNNVDDLELKESITDHNGVKATFTLTHD